MTGATLLVCESSNRWTVALRWGLGSDPARLTVTHDWNDCWMRLEDAPASFLALELNEVNLESSVGRLQDVARKFPQARASVMCDRSLAACQWVMREAGAVHVAVSARDIAALIRLAQRHFEAVRQPEVGYRQGVWDRLPWQHVQTKRITRQDQSTEHQP